MKTDSRTETDLVKLAHDDLQAFGELVERYRDSIQRQCFSRVGDRHHAEDLAQEAFVRAYLKLNQLSSPELFPNWLRKIASNVCNEFLRSSARRESPTDLLPEQAAGDSEPTDNTPLDSLPEQTRDCVDLFYNSGLSYSEIAQALHTTVKSVKGRLSRARAVLRKELAEMEPRKRSAFTQRVLDTLEELKREDPNTRERAASKLHSALAPDRIDGLLSRLATADPLDRSYTIRASRRYVSPRVRDALVDVLLHDEWEENRLKAANALVAQRDPSVIPYLEQAMADPGNPSDVAGAAKSAIKQLQMLEPPADAERERLGFRWELAQAADRPESRAELLSRLKTALGDENPGVRSQALKALGELGDRRAVPAIVKLLDDSHDGIRAAAALALGDIGGKRAEDALIGAFERASERKPPTVAFTSLTRIGTRRALPHILDAIGPGTVFGAMEFAQRVATPADLPLIRNALQRFTERNCPPPWARAISLLAAEHHSPEIIEDMARFPMGLEIAASLAKIGDANAAAALRESLLSHPSSRAAEILAECGEAGTDALRAALGHPNEHVRRAACSGIASTGRGEELRTEIEELAANDPSPYARFGARVASRRCGRGKEGILPPYG